VCGNISEVDAYLKLTTLRLARIVLSKCFVWVLKFTIYEFILSSHCTILLDIIPAITSHCWRVYLQVTCVC